MAPPSTRRPRGCAPGKVVDLDQRRLRLLERSLEKTRSELAVMEARWFHAMAEMRRLQRRLEVGASELAAVRERLSRIRPRQGDASSAARAALEQAERQRRWWERWP